MKLFSVITAIALMCGSVQADELSLEQVMEATCRVTCTTDTPFGKRNGYGSGTVVDKKNGKYYILTNGHVAVSDNKTAFVEFFDKGLKTSPIPAKIVWRDYENGSTIDLAILEVDANSIPKTPRIIPIAKDTFKPSAGQRIYGAGSPGGKWMQAWNATISKVNRNYFIINMPPEGGQSGSGILATVDNDTRLVGIVTWRFNNDDSILHQNGGGVSLSRIYEILNRKAEIDAVSQIDNVAHEDICSRCNHEKGEHMMIRWEDGTYGDKLYCPDSINFSVVGGELIKYSIVIPNNTPTQRPPVEEPPSILPDERDEIIDSLKNQIDNMIKDNLVKDAETLLLNKEKESLELNLDAANIAKAEADNAKVEAEGAKAEAEAKNKDLQNENKALSDELESFLNRWDIPALGPFGTFLSAALAAFASGTVLTTVWHRYFYPYLVSKFGYFPTKIIERIGASKLQAHFNDKVSSSVPVSFTAPTSDIDIMMDVNNGNRVNIDVNKIVNQVVSNKMKEFEDRIVDRVEKALDIPSWKEEKIPDPESGKADPNVS